jgi:serine/threonine-protein kinase
MAPAQVRGGELDGRTDIYAIGVLLFRTLTGRYPFHGPTAAATMMAHLNESTPSFYQVDPRLQPPEGLEAVVRRCLEKDPDRRFANIGELLTALRPYNDPGAEVSSTDVFSATLVRGEPTRGPHAPAVEPDQRAERGLLMAALGLGAAGLGLAGVWWMLQSGTARPAQAGVVAPVQPAETTAAPSQPVPTTAAPPTEATAPPSSEPLAPPSAEPPRAQPAAERPEPAKAKPIAARPSSPKPAAAPIAKPPAEPSPNPKPAAEPPPAGYKGVPDDL